MTEEELRAIERKLDEKWADGKDVCPEDDVRALIAEVRRLQRSNLELRGVARQAIDF